MFCRTATEPEITEITEIMENSVPCESRSTENNDNSDSDTSEDSPKTVKMPDFGEIDKMIVEGIKKLGGEVFVKLNWSAPLDATWASANQLKVSHPLHIWQLLKSYDTEGGT